MKLVLILLACIVLPIVALAIVIIPPLLANIPSSFHDIE
jgi:hypothetical protein